MSLKIEKQALREELTALRDAIPADERAEAAARITERLVVACEGLGAVMVFLSIRSEVPTQGILERLGREGHRLAVPHLDGTEIRPVAYLPGENLTSATWGIPEPADLRPVDPKSLDVVAAPGLGFDREGSRIGYGGGFYDRLFIRTRPDCLRVGIGFHTQLAESVPHGSKDQAIDLIITESETVVCNR